MGQLEDGNRKKCVIVSCRDDAKSQLGKTGIRIGEREWKKLRVKEDEGRKEGINRGKLMREKERKN